MLLYTDYRGDLIGALVALETWEYNMREELVMCRLRKKASFDTAIFSKIYFYLFCCLFSRQDLTLQLWLAWNLLV